MDDPICLTVEAAARACSLSRSKLYELIAAGDGLPVVRVGRSVRVRRVDLEAWVERHISQPEPPPADFLRW